MNYAFFVSLRATREWLALPRERRRALAAEHLQPLLADGRVRMRHFDAEAFTAECSDVLLLETDDPQRHYHFMEALRDSPLVTHPYFEILRIVPAIEDGYVAYERELERAR